MKTAIITGISGQVGSYLAQLLINNGYKVIGTVRSKTPLPVKNLEYLKISDQVIIERVDLLDRKAVSSIIIKYSPDELYNLAAQSSVALSFK